MPLTLCHLVGLVLRVCKLPSSNLISTISVNMCACLRDGTCVRISNGHKVNLGTYHKVFFANSNPGVDTTYWVYLPSSHRWIPNFVQACQ